MKIHYRSWEIYRTMLQFHLKTCAIKSLFASVNIILIFYNTQNMFHVSVNVTSAAGISIFLFYFVPPGTEFLFSGSKHSQFLPITSFTNSLTENGILSKKSLTFFLWKKKIRFSLNINGKRVWRKFCILYPRVPPFIPFQYVLMRTHEE